MEPSDPKIETAAVDPPPNGPARVVTDNKRERFKLDYGGDIVYQAGVKLIRGEKITTCREAGARLFVLSKFDGWDVVTQTVRIAAIGALPGDIVTMDGYCPVIDDAVVTEIIHDEANRPAVHSASHDWILSVDAGPKTEYVCEDIPVRGTPETTVPRIAIRAEGTEIMLRFRPHYRQRHQSS